MLTPQDEKGKFIIENFRTMPNTELAEKVNITYDALRAFMKRNNLVRTKEEIFSVKSKALTGREFSKETRRKMREAQIGKRATKETKEKMSKIRIGKKIHSEEWKKKNSERMIELWKTKEYRDKAIRKGYTHSKETKEKMSIAASKRISKNKGRGFFRAQTGWYKSKNNGKVWYRSGWEKKYMEKLDNDNSVINWEYEVLVLPYYDNKGIKRHYTPDFLVEYKDGTKELVEIHPQGIKYYNDKEKQHAAKAWCEANDTNWRLITKL